MRYSGRLTDTRRLEEFKEEFEDIARISRWPYEVMSGETSPQRRWAGKSKGTSHPVQTLSPPLHLQGIKIVVHPQTDPLWFAFDREGELTQLSYYPLDQYAREKPGIPISRRLEFVRQTQASVQTLLAGPETHKSIINLLAYAKMKYVADLKVEDESGYWDSRDETVLEGLMMGNRK